ncbi:CBS domain protein [Aeromicrobium marinum DSM 15272]|uniref:CBS domain protein n=1 Tax=Aeromicrobium marinum DSM 15272 TaxID=585531 RepID=E2SCK8_9ACTN|nr:CBS domain-containing protein [Aeromicrobium marinum]EFQ82961.1 CBS domain protein [Aeromicrobium marinum DSM 15272]
MRVRDIMTTKGSDVVHTISPEASVRELLDLLAEHDIGALVVSTDGDRLAGIVSERDVVRKLRGVPDPNAATVATIMTAEVITCGPDDSAGSLMAIMTQRRVRHVPVVDDGHLVGILSVGDAVKHRMDQLEFERDQLTSYLQS